MANIKEADSEDTSETDYSPKLIKRQKISASSSLGEKILTKSRQPDSPPSDSTMISDVSQDTTTIYHMYDSQVNKQIHTNPKVVQVTPNQDSAHTEANKFTNMHYFADSNTLPEVQGGFTSYSNAVRGQSSKYMEIINLLNSDETEDWQMQIDYAVSAKITDKFDSNT